MDILRKRRTLLAALATAALLAGGTGAAAADGSPAPAPTGDGAKALCDRVPKIDRRIDQALKRLDAGAGTRGSVARLERRVEKAKKAGNAEVVTFLEGRLKARKALAPVLEQRQKDLAEVKEWCQDDDGGKAAS
ncbi:hypothetical protein AB0M39_01740 [Streptomyces sp. NPDC051907]|uniref:hypothetical protein n=1 Tax=Streptomyces sp. NPDC051907 TaxID=3155284 RepID=UPI00342F19FC